MMWKWIVLLGVLTTVCSLDFPNDLRQTPSVSVNSNKNVNKARHKKSRNTNPPSTTATEPRDAHEPYFPDVIYPTSLLDVSQPFYFSQPGHDVLGPFSNDVKSSYKTLNLGKGKPANDNSKRPEKNAPQNLTVDRENYNGLSSNEPLSQNMSTTNTENVDKDELSHVEDNIGQILNGSGVSEDIMNQYDPLHNEHYLNHGTFENPLENADIVHENMSYSNMRDENLEYIHENPTTTTNRYDDVTLDAAQDLLGDAAIIDSSSNKTYHVNVNPSYVMTSDTGNSHEDFVNDILNIYSLIEESIRAISVVEFVVSKTLGALGLDEKQNATITSEDVDHASNVTDLYDDNVTTSYNVVDHMFTNNLYKPTEMFSEDSRIESNALTSEINEVGRSRTQEIPKCAYNNYQSDCILEKKTDENVTQNMYSKRSTIL